MIAFSHYATLMIDFYGILLSVSNDGLKLLFSVLYCNNEVLSFDLRGIEMRKIIRHPAVDAVLTFIIAYILIYKTWHIGDLLMINLPQFFGLDLLSVMGENLYVTWYMYFNFISVWICGLVIILLFRNYRPILKSFSPELKGNTIKSAVIGGLSLGFGLNLLIAFAAIITGAIKIHYVGLGIGTFVLLFISVLVQAGAEEFVARAFIYQRLRKDFPKWPMVAILGNALFFLLMHLDNPGISLVSELTMVLVSVMYSLVVYYYDSIWIPIVAHTTWNFTQNIILGLPNSGIVFPVSMFKLDAGTDNFAFDSSFGIEGAVLLLILNGIVCFAVFYFGRRKGASETNIWE